MNKFEKMNNFKGRDFNFSDEIILCLNDMGYESAYWDDDIIPVLQKMYSSKNGLYDTYINIEKEKVSYYKEYNCGGCVDKGEFKIPEVARYSLEEFINFMGEVFDNIDFE